MAKGGAIGRRRALVGGRTYAGLAGIATGSVRRSATARRLARIDGTKGRAWVGRRLLFEALLPDDPLSQYRGREAAHGIKALIPCGPRDLSLLPLCVLGIRESLGLQLDGVEIVMPPELIADSLGDLPFAPDVTVTDERRYVPDILLDRSIGASRLSWVRQQLVKMNAVAESDHEAVLVVDADTILLSPRVFYADGKQIIAPSYEYHDSYFLHTGALLGPEINRGFSCVTHHQLMQPCILRDPPGYARFSDLLNRAVETCSDRSMLSEYELYASLLMATRPGQTILARWGNVPVSRRELASLGVRYGSSPSELLAGLRDRFPGRLSASSHWYL